MKFLVIIIAVACAAQAQDPICEVGRPSGQCASTRPYCPKGYECMNEVFCCSTTERKCPHNQRSHGLCDGNGQCRDPGHQCYTTYDYQRVCCNKNPPNAHVKDA